MWVKVFFGEEEKVRFFRSIDRFDGRKFTSSIFLKNSVEDFDLTAEKNRFTFIFFPPEEEKKKMRIVCYKERSIDGFITAASFFLRIYTVTRL